MRPSHDPAPSTGSGVPFVFRSDTCGEGAPLGKRAEQRRTGLTAAPNHRSLKTKRVEESAEQRRAGLTAASNHRTLQTKGGEAHGAAGRVDTPPHCQPQNGSPVRSQVGPRRPSALKPKNGSTWQPPRPYSGGER